MDRATTHDGVDAGTRSTREALETDIRSIEARIAAFNTHWLNHKHLFPGFSVLVMALIFLGMLYKSIEPFIWMLCGALVAALVCVMAWRGCRAKRLNADMEAAQASFKAYERGRRKKAK